MTQGRLTSSDKVNLVLYLCQPKAFRSWLEGEGRTGG